MNGFRFQDVTNVNYSEVPRVLVGEVPVQADEFALMQQLFQQLSVNGQPFLPEWIYQKNMPDEVKAYIRSNIMQRVEPINSGRDFSGLSDADMLDLVPQFGENVDTYSARIRSILPPSNTNSD